MTAESPLVDQLRADGGRFLAAFAGVDNVAGVRHLLDLGVDAGALFADGDGYFDGAKNSLGLHAHRRPLAAAILMRNDILPVTAPRFAETGRTTC